jgi:hypothetical protein
MRIGLGVVVAVVTLHAADALACGGLFCSASQPVPVDQNAERILFEIEEDGSVTATVEIQYSGDPSAFSWIIPVPETPELGVADAAALRVLDQLTRPQVTPPPQTCDSSGGGGIPLGFGCAASAPLDGFAVNESAPGAGPSVDVENLPRVGPYDDIVVVDSVSTDALVDWLNTNDYVVTPAMEPIMAEYVAEGSKFLALKLAPDAGISDIQPIRFTCPGQDGIATIPLRLTAVSAEPEMGVLVFVAAPTRYESASWPSVSVPDEDVRFSNQFGQYNYFALVSWLVDEAGGRAFVPELAQSSASVLNRQVFDPVTFEAVDVSVVRPLLDEAFVTRFYTRVSGWEMESDPTFRPLQTSLVDDGAIDLSTQPAEEVCAGAASAPVPCGDTYCGEGARCAATSDGDGCVCRSGTAARAIADPAGRPTAHCQVTSVDYLADLQLQDALCGDGACGDDGRCVVVNGFATCACDAGFAAVPLPAGGARVVGDPGLRCRRVIREYDPEQLLWEEPELIGEGDGSPDVERDAGCGATPEGEASGFLTMLFAAVWLLRRTLRRL